MTPPRAKSKPVFDPSALNDDLDDLWPGKPTAPPRPQPVATTAQPSPSPPPVSAQAAPPSAAQAPQPPVAVPSPAAPAPRLRSVSAAAAAGEVQTRYRPPEVLLSAEVYDALYHLQITEKKTRRGLARPMGAIVLDAIEKHADQLATTWDAMEDTVGEGGLFARPSSSAVPRRRRHAVAPRTVVLSGVNAANGRRLDELVPAWGAGTRSALVEQALRYEFNLT
ncbi:hypothetical protein MI149_29810 (plasmid) [Mycolicibacterium crocinum]|uniref:Uncharacterized protein n=1 Tax=Mycolicibacterium crocinum TaxID=388459 RepID=A0ABY3TTB3_9MYCO|nr:hypothetical protein [Mycolicibacterium crocinum]ULN44693.1 hypothetical protein MI149_29810 [Mycolicibacterium crocinum]